jgi:hypothetical protein
LKKRVYLAVEVEPEFPGGKTAMTRFIFKNLRYPDTKESDDLKSHKAIEFIVDIGGTLKKIHIDKTGNESLTALEKEVITIIRKMPKWTPGRCEEKLVATLYKLPITVCLQSE